MSDMKFAGVPVQRVSYQINGIKTHGPRLTIGVLLVLPFYSLFARGVDPCLLLQVDPWGMSVICRVNAIHLHYLCENGKCVPQIVNGLALV